MKINHESFINEEYKGKKVWKLVKVSESINAYVSNYGNEMWFESETDERIGGIYMDDVRTSWKNYFTASWYMGWDWKPKTKKAYWRNLCTRANYENAVAMLKEAYKNRKVGE